MVALSKYSPLSLNLVETAFGFWLMISEPLFFSLLSLTTEL